MLTENVLISFDLGVIGHIQKMEDMPDKGDVFFIADSWKKVLLGPFVITGSQKYHDQPIEFHRGVPITRLEPCHWLTEFQPHPDAGSADNGILWNAIADQIGLSHRAWLNIRHIQLSPDQLDWLYNELILTNNGIAVNGEVKVEDMRRSKEDWAVFIEGVDEGQFGDDDAYYSTYEGMVDLLYDGDYTIAEANMRED